MTEESAPATAGHLGADQFLARLPADVLDSLTPEQTAAIRTAVEDRCWGGDPPVNLRLTIPLPGRRFFLAVVAGPERRSDTRRLTERLGCPLWTAGNIAFVVGLAATLVAAAVVGVLVWAGAAGG